MAAMNETTLGAAMTVNDNKITLASGNTVKTGHIFFVDREAMLNQGPVGESLVQFHVHRGWTGTAAKAHASGAKTKTGPPQQFQVYSPSGAAVAAENTTPWVNVHTGDVFDVQSGVWKKVGDDGVAAGTPVWP